MKYIKILISVMLILTIALVSCKKDSSTGPAGGSIEGTWNVVDAYFGWLVTTNSNQVATNIFDVTGQISISGAHTVTLNYMWMDDDPLSFMIFDFNDDDNNYFLLLDGTTGEGTFITNDGQTFMGNVTFTYNNGTLTITQSTITDVAGDATVTISGSLSFTQTNIPANTPTLIQFSDDFVGGDDFGLTTITFNNDGTVTVTDVFEGVTDTETWTYTTDGNQLTVIDEDGETMIYEYSITGNTLTMVATDFENICEDYDSQAECFADMEEFFNLTPGSLTDVSMRVEIILNKAAAKQGLNIGRKINLINPTKGISDYKLKIDNIKQAQ